MSTPPGAVLINKDIGQEVRRIKNEPGKDIWLFGGAGLTASLMNLGLVDVLWLSVHPILLGVAGLGEIAQSVDLLLVPVNPDIAR